MTIKETLQFVGDLKIILQGIKLIAQHAEDDPLRELIRGLDRKITEFEAHLRTLLRQRDFPARNSSDDALAHDEGDRDDDRVVDATAPLSPSEVSRAVSRDVSNDGDWSVEVPDLPDGPTPNPITLVSNLTHVEERDGGGEDAVETSLEGGSDILQLNDDLEVEPEPSSDNHLVENDEETALRCSVCLKTFAKACHLRQHVFIKHEGGVLEKQVCPFCGKSFEARYLKGHISTAHEGHELRCDVCAKSFATVSALNVHRKNIHGGRRFACHNCDKSFASKWGLEVHFAKEHEKRSYPCQLCDSVLKTENLLRRHMQGVHERIRHSCSTCSASFTQKSQLTYHVKLKHGQGQEGGRLECEKCKKVYVIPWKLRLHQKKCVAALEGNVGYAQIAASLASLSD